MHLLQQKTKNKHEICSCWVTRPKEPVSNPALTPLDYNKFAEVGRELNRLLSGT